MTSINTTADLVEAGLIDDERSEDELDDQLADDEGLYGDTPQIPLSRFLYDDDDLAQDRFDCACYDPPHID